MSSNDPVVCRPTHLTCRWISEISEAISKLVPTQKAITECSNLKRNELESLWHQYYETVVQNERCRAHPLVNQILSGEIDYNDYRNN